MRYYRIEMVGHGGEAVCGSVSEEAYDYWTECEEDLDDYVDEEIPQIDRYWHDIDDIAHLNGCDNGTLRIVEVDGSGAVLSTLELQHEDDASWFDEETNADYTLPTEYEIFDDEHPKLSGTHYFVGISAEKGQWTTSELIETDDNGLDPNDISLTYRSFDAFDWGAISSLSYGGKEYRFDSDTTGKGHLMMIGYGC